MIFKIFINIWLHKFNQGNKINSILRFLKWQFFCLFFKYKIIYNITENGKIILEKGLTGATGNLYNGLQEFNDMGFLLHFLRSEDLFLDIGANVGVYTILASSEIKAKTFSFEPSPETFLKLQENININNINNNVNLYNFGLGEKVSNIFFTNNLDTTNHVVENNCFNSQTISINLYMLDDIVINNIPSLIKIDVEGYELNVLKGSNKILSNPTLKALIIELNGSGIKYNYNDIDVHNFIINYGFKPYDYNPLTRELLPLKIYGKFNTIYIRDYDFVIKRIFNSKKIQVKNRFI